MADVADVSGLELRSKITSGGELELWLEDVTTPELAADEVVIRVEASPINPSDLGVLLGPADLSTIRSGGTDDRPTATASIPRSRMAGVAGRLDESMLVGNEGAGVVVKAGADLQALIGRTLATRTPGMYAQYRVAKASECMVLPEGTTPKEGASAFINPLTALGMVETMRREGHTALVHTAAASNLGQMLNRVCLADGIALGERRPQHEAGRHPPRDRREVRARQHDPHLRQRAHRRAGRNGGDAGVRRGRRRDTGRDYPVEHGGGRRPQGDDLQPLWLAHPQAGLHLWHPRYRADGDRSQFRHGLGRRGLAADLVHAEDRPTGRAAAARPGCGRADDDIRQPLYGRDIAGPGVVARRDCGL